MCLLTSLVYKSLFSEFCFFVFHVTPGSLKLGQLLFSKRLMLSLFFPDVVPFNVSSLAGAVDQIFPSREHYGCPVKLHHPVHPSLSNPSSDMAVLHPLLPPVVLHHGSWPNKVSVQASKGPLRFRLPRGTIPFCGPLWFPDHRRLPRQGHPG